MQLSKNFALWELTKSQTALRHGISNLPNEEQLGNLKALCENILQPVRDYYGKPVRISSGYRSPELNRRIGGSSKSQHSHGKAADFEIFGVSNKELAEWIKTNCPFDQCILEYYKAGDPNSGWVHVSYDPARDRRQALRTSNGRDYLVGFA